ncbi:MAG: hypothetical protein J7M38_10630 [Armatimonadetes bacterium]|nr:hypothetical protein [Armatimonadota bacterium]
MRKLVKLWADEDGVMSVETALVVMLVSLAAVGMWQRLSETINNRVADTNTHLQVRP